MKDKQIEMTEKFEPQPAIYRIIINDIVFHGSDSYAKDLPITGFPKLLGYRIFQRDEESMIKMGISIDDFLEQAFSLKIVADDYYSVFDPQSNNVTRVFNENSAIPIEDNNKIVYNPLVYGNVIMYDIFHRTIDDGTTLEEVMSRIPQLGYVLRECSYKTPSPEILGEFIFHPDDWLKKQENQKYIIEVNFVKLKGPTNSGPKNESLLTGQNQAEVSAIYKMILGGKIFHLAASFSRQISMDQFFPVIGTLMLKKYPRELNELGISYDFFTKNDCSLKITTDQYTTSLGTHANLSFRQFKNGNAVIFDPKHISIKARVDKFGRPIISKPNIQLGEFLKSNSYVEPSPHRLKIYEKFPNDFLGDSNYQKYIIQVEPMEKTVIPKQYGYISKDKEPEQITQSNSSVLDLLDKIGCQKCGHILSQKAMEILRKKKNVYCPNCGRLIQFKVEY